jgi:hypothetical protein
MAEKVKEKLTEAKDKVKDDTDKVTNTTKKSRSSASTSTQDRGFEEGGPGRDHEYGRKDDPLTDYRDNT